MQIIADRPYVVYYHLIDGHIFYIGSGKLSRAFDHGSQMRNEAWNAFSAGRPVDVVVFRRFALRAEARRVEYAAINAWRPIANFPSTPGAPLDWLPRQAGGYLSAMKPHEGERIRVEPWGWTFKTVTDAAKATKVSLAAVCNSISGKYPMVGDLMFYREPIPKDCLFPFNGPDEIELCWDPAMRNLQEFFQQIGEE